MITPLVWFPLSVKPVARKWESVPRVFITVEYTLKAQGLKPKKCWELYMAVYAFDHQFRILHRVGDDTKGLRIADDIFDRICSWAYCPQPVILDEEEEDLLA